MEPQTDTDAIGEHASPPEEVREPLPTNETPAGRPSRTAGGTGLFDLLASQESAAASHAPGASVAANGETGTGPVSRSAWARGPPRRPRAAPVPTRHVKLPASPQSTTLYEQTITITLTGSGWGAVRNAEVIVALAEHGVDLRTIQAIWKAEKLRHLYITFNSKEEAEKSVRIRRMQIGDVTATIRGKATTTEVRVHYVPGWMATATVVELFQQYGEVQYAEHATTEIQGIKMKTGTVHLRIKADHHQARAIPPRIEIEEHEQIVNLMVNVRGQPPHCWACGSVGHTSHRCGRTYDQPAPPRANPDWLQDDRAADETIEIMEEEATAEEERTHANNMDQIETVDTDQANQNITEELVPDTQTTIQETQVVFSPTLSPETFQTPTLSTPSSSVLQGLVSQTLSQDSELNETTADPAQQLLSISSDHHLTVQLETFQQTARSRSASESSPPEKSTGSPKTGQGAAAAAIKAVQAVKEGVTNMMKRKTRSPLDEETRQHKPPAQRALEEELEQRQESIRQPRTARKQQPEERRQRRSQSGRRSQSTATRNK